MDLRLGVDVPLDAHFRIKLHDAGGNRGIEKLQTAFVKPQAQIVVGAVGIDAVERIVRQGFLDLLHRIIRFRDQVAVGIPLGVLGQRKVHAAIDKAEHQHGSQHYGRPTLAIPEEVPQHAEDHQSQHRYAQDGPEAGGFLGDAEGGHAVIIGIGHQAERRRRESNGQRQTPGAGQFPPGQVGPCQQRRRGPAQHQHRHVVPPGVVAGIEGIEQAVKDGHKGADHAHL